MVTRTSPDAPGARDEVDRIVLAWERERPDLDVRPLTVLSRVSRLARHLDLARRSAFARHDLETWEFDVLSALRRAGAPYRLSPGALLTQTLVTSGTMTNRIDRLAEHGLVRAAARPRRPPRGPGAAHPGRPGRGWTPRSPTCSTSSAGCWATSTRPTATGWPTCCAR